MVFNRSSTASHWPHPPGAVLQIRQERPCLAIAAFQIVGRSVGVGQLHARVQRAAAIASIAGMQLLVARISAHAPLVPIDGLPGTVGAATSARSFCERGVTAPENGTIVWASSDARAWAAAWPPAPALCSITRLVQSCRCPDRAPRCCGRRSLSARREQVGVASARARCRLLPSAAARRTAPFRKSCRHSPCCCPANSVSVFSCSTAVVVCGRMAEAPHRVQLPLVFVGLFAGVALARVGALNAATRMRPADDNRRPTSCNSPCDRQQRLCGDHQDRRATGRSVLSATGGAGDAGELAVQIEQQLIGHLAHDAGEVLLGAGALNACSRSAARATCAWIQRDRRGHQYPTVQASPGRRCRWRCTNRVAR